MTVFFASGSVFESGSVFRKPPPEVARFLFFGLFSVHGSGAPPTPPSGRGAPEPWVENSQKKKKRHFGGGSDLFTYIPVRGIFRVGDLLANKKSLREMVHV